ncbi:MAG: hypothetical protein ACFFKA_05820 [Candidatus Thorarchaeota archaeon]
MSKIPKPNLDKIYKRSELLHKKMSVNAAVLTELKNLKGSYESFLNDFFEGIIFEE